MRDYRKIHAWKLADDLVVEVYRVTQAFPKHEVYGLVSQMRRAATSVPANIAEGCAREGNREYLQFLRISRGSLNEVHYFVHLSKRLEYLPAADSALLDQLLSRTFACLHALILTLERQSA